MNRILTLDNCKSYATEANLQKAMDKVGFVNEGDRAIICRTSEGRWTAIYQWDMRQGGYVAYYAQHGFMTI